MLCIEEAVVSRSDSVHGIAEDAVREFGREAIEQAVGTIERASLTEPTV